jgi:hypothetical protein
MDIMDYMNIYYIILLNNIPTNYSCIYFIFYYYFFFFFTIIIVKFLNFHDHHQRQKYLKDKINYFTGTHIYKYTRPRPAVGL